MRWYTDDKGVIFHCKCQCNVIIYAQGGGGGGNRAFAQARPCAVKTGVVYKEQLIERDHSEALLLAAVRIYLNNEKKHLSGSVILTHALWS